MTSSYKIFDTIVMDGSNLKVVYGIGKCIDVLTEDDRLGKVLCRRFDADHSSMIAIRVITTPKNYKFVRECVEDHYPGLCVFDPPLKVI